MSSKVGRKTSKKKAAITKIYMSSKVEHNTAEKKTTITKVYVIESRT